MKRKFGGLLLALCMALCLLPSAAFAADGVACPRCGRTETVSVIEGRFDTDIFDKDHHYQAYRCSWCVAQYGADSFVTNQALPHRGGTATCTERARCEDCHWAYGAVDPENHSYVWKAADGQYWQECERYGVMKAKQALPALTIVGADKVCRTQDYTFTFTVPEGCTQPGSGYEFPMIGSDADVKVEGGVATGTVKADWYDKTEDSFTVLASVLTADGYFVSVSKEISIVDGHEGGEATCAQRAVCAVCGEVYGEPDPTNHTAMRHVDAKAATVTDEGNIEYWTCAECGRYFLDAAGEKEIEEADIVIEKLPEQPQPEEPKPEEPQPEEPQPEEPKPEDPQPEEPKSDNKTPKTGDDGVAMWMALAGVAIGAAGVIVTGKKKRKTK